MQRRSRSLTLHACAPQGFGMVPREGERIALAMKPEIKLTPIAKESATRPNLSGKLGTDGTFSRITLRSSIKGERIRVASRGARHQPQLQEPNGQVSQTIGKRSVCPQGLKNQKIVRVFGNFRGMQTPPAIETP